MAEVQAALGRVIEAPEFLGSRRRINLLRHLVDETLSGRRDRLKGTSIAIDVFGRGADFDPQTDAVVRSEARRLRHALASYYFGSGASDPLRIVLQKGSYVPRFERTIPEDTWRNIHAPVTPDADGLAAPFVGSAQEFEIVAPTEQPQRWPLAKARTRPFLAILIVLCLGGLLAALWGGRSARVAEGGAMTPSVLVVPFESGRPEDDAFALGISAQLIADLMQFSGFRLYTLLDSLPHDDALVESGPASDADYVVRGTVGGDSQSLTVAARLIDSADGRVLWSKSYTGAIDPDPLVAMQAEIAVEIATAIGQPNGAMFNAAAERIAMANTNGADMSSFECVLQAHTYRQTNKADLYASTRQCLEQAVVRDVSYADAWAMLAYLRLDGGRFGYDTDAEAAATAARVAAVRALSIDAKNVQAMKALSLIEHYSGSFEESQRLARDALELNPNDPDTLAQLGWRLSIRGNFDEGIPYLKRAIERSGKPPGWYFQPIAVERLMAGDMEGMLEAAERSSADGSSVSDALLAIAYGGLGLNTMANEALDRMATKWPLIDRDPAAAFGIHRLREDQIAAIVEGLRVAGWRPHDERVVGALP